MAKASHQTFGTLHLAFHDYKKLKIVDGTLSYLPFHTLLLAHRKLRQTTDCTEISTETGGKKKQDKTRLTSTRDKHT